MMQLWHTWKYFIEYLCEGFVVGMINFYGHVICVKYICEEIYLVSWFIVCSIATIFVTIVY